MNKHLKCALVLILSPLYMAVVASTLVTTALLSIPFFPLQAFGCITTSPLEYLTEKFHKFEGHIREL